MVRVEDAPCQLLCSLLVGTLGIEPSLHEPESCVLPVYYVPKPKRGHRMMCVCRMYYLAQLGDGERIVTNSAVSGQ